MCQTKHGRSGLVLVAVLMAGLLALPSTGLAQLGGLLPPPPTSTSTTPTVVGNASAAQVVLLGLLGTATSTSLASTGISSANAESDVGQDTGSIPSLLGAEVLNAATYSYPDQVDSAVSLADLKMSVIGPILGAALLAGGLLLALQASRPTPVYAHEVPMPCDFTTGGGFILIAPGTAFM